MSTQLILLGAPGSGKGTQAARLVSELGYNHVSTGDLLRGEIAKGTELGLRVQGIMTRGELVDDNTVLELLNANCDLASGSYIFDGFPRNIDQARSLDSEVIKDVSHVAIYFDIDLEILSQRLVNRRTCGDCGEIYNLLSKPPKTDNICDKCSGSNLKQRKDDNVESVKTRLSVFKETIEPVLAYYEGRNSLKRVNAAAGSEDVFEEVRKVIN